MTRDRRFKYQPKINTPYDLTPADQKRFWDHVDMLGDHWWWIGPKFAGKYPELPLDSGVKATAARVALQLVGKPLPDGYNVRYLCMSGECINPEHNSIYDRRGGPWSYLGANGKQDKPKRNYNVAGE